MQTKNDFIQIKDADFPKPFDNGLEFNAPVHGSWNIVHIGLQMPEAVQIYVCAKNCMRGVILTAAEMNESDRFSFVILEEKDVISENIEKVTVDGVIDVIKKRIKAGCKPKAVQLFTVCLHHFLGCDYDRIYNLLENEFPDIDFYRCYMDPIKQKKGPTPDQKLRLAMCEKLENLEVKQEVVSVLGNDFLLDESSDLVRFLKEAGFELRQNKGCSSYEDYKNLSEASTFISTNPLSKMGVELAAKRLGRKFIYLPSDFNGKRVRKGLLNLAKLLGIEEDKADLIIDKITDSKALENELLELKQEIGDREICIDGAAHPRPFGMAKLLVSSGLNVTKIYTDFINPEEEEDFNWLKDNKPDLIISATIHVHKRILSNTNDKKVIAIGQKAAYFEQTPYFVNIVSGFGLWGLDGSINMLKMIKEADLEEKDLRDIVPRKGLGCESCI